MRPRGAGDVLERNDPRARLLLGSDDAELKAARRVIPAQTARDGAPADIRGDDLGPQTVAKESARALFRKMKTDGRGRHRRADLISDLDNQRPHTARPGRMQLTLAFDDLDMKSCDLSGRRRRERYNQRRRGKIS